LSNQIEQPNWVTKLGNQTEQPNWVTKLGNQIEQPNWVAAGFSLRKKNGSYKMWWRDWGIIIVLLLPISCTRAVSPLRQYQARRHYEYGLSYLYLNDVKAAEAEFAQAQQLNPQEAKAYEGQALVYAQQGKYKAALEQLKQALSLNPGLASAYLHASDIYLKLKDWPQAALYAQKALALPSLKQQRPQAHYNAGLAWFGLAKYELAQVEFEKALEEMPYWVEAHYWRGKSLIHIGQASQAVAEYRIALAQAQTHPDEADRKLLARLHYELGQAYLRKNYINQGIRELKTALQLYPLPEAQKILKSFQLSEK